MPDDEPFAFGLPLPIPPELAEVLAKRHDMNHMAVEATTARVEAFLSGLDVDGLMAMRTILNQGDMTKSLTANFFDGQLVSILKYVKHVDPETGKDPLALDDPTP